MSRILITGGAGYVGSLLTINLERLGHEVLIYDTCFYGKDHIQTSAKLKLIEGDIRDKNKFESAVQGCDIVIHLACISNDPTFELNPDISKEVNFHCFEPIVRLSKENGVKKFIYASTCSVYGISDNPNVTEEHPLVPITDYNKYKAACEPILKKYLDDDFHGIIIRPATICGFSEKMRFDLTVNILTAANF